MKYTITVIAFALVLSGCSKNKTTDIRDSLVGNYVCVTHYFVINSNPNYPNTDTITGSRIMTVEKSVNGSLVINSNAYFFKDSNSQETVYNLENYCDQITTYTAQFFKQNDSIYFYNNVCGSIGGSAGYYYLGHKQH